MARIPVSLLSALAVLAACGSADEPTLEKPRDPQVAQALDDPLMTDPDLSSRNEAAAALTVEADLSLPILPATPEAVAAAQAEAAALVGGAGRMLEPPAPTSEVPPLGDRSVAGHLSAIPGGTRCTAALQGSTVWAARLPTSLPVYPRGATWAAAGSDAEGCGARVVDFTTPVPLEDVIAFYWTRTLRARLSPVYALSGKSHVVSGGDDSLAFDLRAERRGDETVVRLATLRR